MDVAAYVEMLIKTFATYFVALSIPLVTSAQVASAACAQSPQRKIVYWTDYAPGGTPEYEAAFGHLRAVVNKEISRLPYALSQSALEDGDIPELESEPTGTYKPLPYALNGPAAHRDWWNRAQSMIGMFHGSIHSSPPLKVFSSLYSETIALPMVANDPGVDVQSDAQGLIDSHNLMIAYAVAMDAQARNCSTHTVYDILERANEIALQLKIDNQLNGDLKIVAEAIERKLMELAGP